MHLNENVSLDSNVNAIFQEHIQMQMFWGRTKMQMFWLHMYKCILINFKYFGFILTFCFIWRKNNVMYTNTLLIYLINTVVQYCNHQVPLHEQVCSHTLKSHSSGHAAEFMFHRRLLNPTSMAGNERLIIQVGQKGRVAQYNRLSTGGVTGMITWWIITATTNHSHWL